MSLPFILSHIQSKLKACHFLDKKSWQIYFKCGLDTPYTSFIYINNLNIGLHIYGKF